MQLVSEMLGLSGKLSTCEVNGVRPCSSDMPETEQLSGFLLAPDTNIWLGGVGGPDTEIYTSYLMLGLFTLRRHRTGH